MALKKAFGHFLLLIIVAVTGLGIATLFELSHPENTLVYRVVATGLLCSGLFLAIAGIDKESAREHWLFIALALGLGVVCKYLIISQVAYAASGNWRMLVWGMLVVAIDPIAVSAASHRTNKSTGTILGMWASFDDPLSVVLAPFAVAVAAGVSQERIAQADGWADSLLGLLPLVAVMLAVGLLSMLGKRVLFKKPDDGYSATDVLIVGASSFTQTATTITAALAFVFQPKRLQETDSRFAEIAGNMVLGLATLMLGLLLADGARWSDGLVLGLPTYGSQIVVAWLVMAAVRWLKRRSPEYNHLPLRDVWQVALAQQNGMTAIVLALSFEPIVDGSVAAVASTILVVNTIYFVINTITDRLMPPVVAESEPCTI